MCLQCVSPSVRMLLGQNHCGRGSVHLHGDGRDTGCRTLHVKRAIVDGAGLALMYVPTSSKRAAARINRFRQQLCLQAWGGRPQLYMSRAVLGTS